MSTFRKLLPLAAICGLAHAADTALPAEGGASEKDFLGDLPIVLSVSRLAQPLDETPGAVTIIDRDMIRRSGAREVAEVLRLVPGFVSTRTNGGNPLAMYHAAMDAYGARMQVFIDGRSIFSTYQFGNTQWGLTGLALDDIERIEVLRGSNSAAVGGNAYLGVVNVVTRHTRDTLGGFVSTTHGGGGISDQTARLGWGNDAASFRVTTSTRGDSGFDGIYDNNRVSLVDLRGDLRPSAKDEVAIFAGAKENKYAEGTRLSDNDPQRVSGVDSAYVNARWVRQLDNGDDVQLTVSHDHERINNGFRYPNLGAVTGIIIDYGGVAHRTKLEAQHTVALGEGLRGVWGGGYTRESVKSVPLFNVDDTLSMHTWRLFGNVEWRPLKDVIVNTGNMFEHNSILGSRNAPRMMINYHVAPGHTLRLGGSRAYRIPTLFELRSDERLFGYTGGTKVFLQNLARARGRLSPETMSSSEIGYLGEIRPLHLAIDIRVFDEDNLSIARTKGYGSFGLLNRQAKDFINAKGPRIRGWETQLRWQPSADLKVLFNYAETKLFTLTGFDDRTKEEGYAAPTHAATLAVFQRLPHDFDLGVIYTTSGEMSWGEWKYRLPSTTQTDIRLAKHFRFGGYRGEVAATVQAVGGNQRQYVADPAALPLFFDRRAFATLKLEF